MIAGTYANFANISFSRYEFTLTFARIEHEVEEGDVPGAVVSRINASPLLAAARPRRAPPALALWLIAWLAHGLLAQGAAVALIGLAAVTVAEVASMLAPPWSLAIGLVVLAVVDVVLVWGTRDVQPATTALHHAAIPVAAGHPLPRLQDASFGSATMGWLDLVAPALLGVIARERLRAAVATGLAGAAWGLLLLITPTIP